MDKKQHDIGKSTKNKTIKRPITTPNLLFRKKTIKEQIKHVKNRRALDIEGLKILLINILTEIAMKPIRLALKYLQRNRQKTEWLIAI